MVEKMKYINITGPLANMDKVIEKYMARYDIQLEYAAAALGLNPYIGDNPYQTEVSKAEQLLQLTGPALSAQYPQSGLKAKQIVNAAYHAYEKRNHRIHELENQIVNIRQYIDHMHYFSSLNVELHRIDAFTHIHYQFGKIPTENFRQFEKFLRDDAEIVFCVSHRDKYFLWGVYFTPAALKEKTDLLFASLHFESIPISAVCLRETHMGTPAAIIHHWQLRLADLEKKLQVLFQKELVHDTKDIAAACQKVIDLHHLLGVKKYAAITQNEFIFLGWMAEQDAVSLEKETAFTMIYHDDEKPPVRLKNPPVIRLFETLTRMYGLPAYNEIDPTPFIAITYTLLFGLMFGDVGQGLCIAILGYILYQKYQSDLGGIMAVAGLSGAFFGFLYGSIFGLENILPALWRRPHADITGMITFAVGLGVAIVLMSMCLHLINTFRQKNWGEFFFSPNGLAGMVFYGTALFFMVQGKGLSGLVRVLLGLPLSLVIFKEPLTNFLEGKRKLIEGNVGMYLFQNGLTTLETLLTYATNTVSFVRVGAFAISHAGMMSVVLLLSRSASGTNNLLIFILGNILVMGIEGLLVAIQVLRLDFYEIFSRFYTGGGKAFISKSKAA